MLALPLSRPSIILRFFFLSYSTVQTVRTVRYSYTRSASRSQEERKTLIAR